ncbi:MAG: class I SAM-dependent methyltransferase [Chloroflexi bacterium]|nr:class I SAM-dependent methyltransferase [Chloroflexota bacterium]
MGWWIVGGIAALALVALIVYWLVVITEGVYLGRGTVIWLYDYYARRYDGIKQYDPETETYFLALPMMQRLVAVRAPLVLDVATGTGRLPLALLEQPTFQGRIVALDLSRKMLSVAAEKLAPHNDRVSLLHQRAESLPFPDDTFDTVCCLEALEFMMEPRGVLRELARVLRPGGLLVLTNRQGRDAKLMPGQMFSHEALEQMLRDEIGMSAVEVEPWQVDYRIVWALKAGISPAASARQLEEIWRCPRCGVVDLVAVEGGWRCLTCETRVPVGADGVIEAERVRGS